MKRKPAAQPQTPDPANPNRVDATTNASMTKPRILRRCPMTSWDVRNGKPTEKWMVKAIAIAAVDGYSRRNRIPYARAARMVARAIISGTGARVVQIAELEGICPP